MNKEINISSVSRQMAAEQHQQYEISLNPNELDKMFASFISYIDATPNTIRTYRTSLRQWFKYMQKFNIRRPVREDVQAYRQYLKDTGKKATTIQNYIVAVKRFFSWTGDTGLYPNIAAHIKGAKISRSFKKDYLTSKQAKHVLQTIDRSTLIGKRNYAMLALMLTMGLRTIEVSRADVGDIRAKGDAIVLYVQGKGHVEKDAAVKMPEHVEAAIREYFAARKNPADDQPLFTSTSNNNAGQRMTTRSISGIVKGCFQAAGYDSPRLTAHSTRHTAATLSLLHGASLRQTQELLRHRNMQTTEIYAHDLDVTKNPASSDVDKAIFD
jgi:integrase/recombinase XerC